MDMIVQNSKKLREVCAAHQGESRDRKGLHLSQQPPFGGYACDNSRCGTLFGQQGTGAWKHRVHTCICLGEHGEES